MGCASVWGVCVCARTSGHECCAGAWPVSVHAWGLSVWCAHTCVVVRATCECGGLCSRCELTFPFLKFLPFIEHLYFSVCLSQRTQSQCLGAPACKETCSVNPSPRRNAAFAVRTPAPAGSGAEGCECRAGARTALLSVSSPGGATSTGRSHVQVQGGGLREVSSPPCWLCGWETWYPERGGPLRVT